MSPPRILGPREADGSHYKRAHGKPSYDAILAARRKNKGGQCRAYLERDHRTLRAKIAVRVWLLKRLQMTDVQVLDACSGAGYIWTEMEQYVNVRRWVRSDIKPRTDGAPGTVLKMSADQAVSSMDLNDFNVIDIDPYGEPWEAYRVILQRFQHLTAVFLTHGRTAYDVQDVTRDAMGIPRSWPIPQLPAVVDYITQRVLEDTHRWARIVDACRYHVHATAGRSPVTYYGIGIASL